MLDILGWGEFLLILIVAFIVIGPKDLPKVLHTLGEWVASLKHFVEKCQNEFEGLSRLGYLEKLREEKKQKDKNL